MDSEDEIDETLHQPTEEFQQEVVEIELEQDILTYIFYLKEYLEEKVLPIADLLDSTHIQDFIEFII